MTVKQYLKFGRNYLQLFEIISQLSISLLEKEDWCDKITQLINYYSEKMSKSSFLKYKFKGI